MGLTEIQIVFAHTREEGRPALMPYWPLGYPDQATSVKIIHAIVAAGADMLELGVPFSDPLADGPVIQRACQVALEHGTSVQGCIDITSSLRSSGIIVPLLTMGYLNPILAYGESRYISSWNEAGADGFIIPDLPPEESDTLGSLCAQQSMALIQFTAPSSTPQRVAQAVKKATGFVYVVAVTGVTGARDALATGLRNYVERVKIQANGKPVVVGFGISKPDHVREVGQFADGVIVASALIRAVSESSDPVQTAFDFVNALRIVPRNTR